MQVHLARPCTWVLLCCCEAPVLSCAAALCFESLKAESGIQTLSQSPQGPPGPGAPARYSNIDAEQPNTTRYGTARRGRAY